MRTKKFVIPSGGKCVLASDGLEKTFSLLNLSNMTITFAGFMGDFAVWAITDALTGEITYLVDDNGGSEIYILFFFYMKFFMRFRLCWGIIGYLSDPNSI